MINNENTPNHYDKDYDDDKHHDNGNVGDDIHVRFITIVIIMVIMLMIRMILMSTIGLPPSGALINITIIKIIMKCDNL